MDTKGKKIILGSASPRRRELLAGLDLEFTVDTGNTFDEVYDADVPTDDIPSVLSKGKSYGFHRVLENDEILMLKSLSGRDHKVITAITIRDNTKCRTSSDTAVVHFKSLTNSEIEYYVDAYKPFDKAGAYGIQEWIGYIGIDRIDGSYFTIMGLPVHLVYSELQYFLD